MRTKLLLESEQSATASAQQHQSMNKLNPYDFTPLTRQEKSEWGSDRTPRIRNAFPDLRTLSRPLLRHSQHQVTDPRRTSAEGDTDMAERSEALTGLRL